VADAHEFFGPVSLNWEGGHSGERKIQSVKPELGIKRSTVAWQSIVLDRLYQSDGIAWLLDRFEKPGKFMQSRSITDLYRVFPNEIKMRETVLASEPLAAITSTRHIFLLHRPTAETIEDCGPDNSGDVTVRSTIWLTQMEFADNEGRQVGCCWFAPLQFSVGKPTITGIGSLADLHVEVELRLLLLPLVIVGDTNSKFGNMYYGIADDWTERKQGGDFKTYSLDPTLFRDWNETLNTDD
jgi:hypothetical protein